MITKQRAKEILKAYNDPNPEHDVKKGYNLFNWCEEYKDFIGNCVHGCVSYEVEYILKKSWEDNEAPFSYEDIDLFDLDKAKEHILYNFDDDEEKFKEYSNNPDTFNRKVKNKGDFEVFLNSLDKEELKELFNEFNLDTSEADAEVYEWWVISDPLKYRLEQQNEVFLEGGCCSFWGRCTSGQAISLDSCCINAFINLLKDVQ